MAETKKKKLPSGRHASQIKRERQTLKRTERNRHIRSELRTTIKKVRQACQEGGKEAAQAALKLAIPKIQKAASKGILHKNNAARNVGRLTKLVQSL